MESESQELLFGFVAKEAAAKCNDHER